jgi:hypothetical protein
MVHLSMPGYISKALQWFAHEPPKRIQNSHHPHVVPTLLLLNFMLLQCPSCWKFELQVQWNFWTQN